MINDANEQALAFHQAAQDEHNDAIDRAVKQIETNEFEWWRADSIQYIFENEILLQKFGKNFYDLFGKIIFGEKNHIKLFEQAIKQYYIDRLEVDGDGEIVKPWL